MNFKNLVGTGVLPKGPSTVPKTLVNQLIAHPLFNFDESIFKNRLRINTNKYNIYKKQFILEKDFKNKSYEIIYNTLININIR